MVSADDASHLDGLAGGAVGAEVRHRVRVPARTRLRELDRRAALAERDELVFLPDRPNDPIELGLDDPILKLLQRIRNEVHRYAVTTHRSARNSRLRRSALEDIPGIGKKRAALLLVKFGSVQRIATLTPEELCELEGVGIKLAKKIIEHLTGGGKG